MGFDSECDVFLEAGARRDVPAAIIGFRDRLLAEHLGVSPTRFTPRSRARGSIAPRSRRCAEASTPWCRSTSIATPGSTA
jgi:hypothetical protein